MYYTYCHSSPTGEVFYIGKGIEDRAYSFNDRSSDWKRAIKHHGGLQIEILAYWDTEEEAFNHEELLIDCFTDLKFNLVNKTKGGKGAYGYKQSEELKKLRSLQMSGYVHKQVTCPHCKKTGGETAMKRWHFDKCTGNKAYRARVSVDGKRIHLGRFETKEQATLAQDNFLEVKG